MKGGCRVRRGGGISSLLCIMVHHILTIYLSVNCYYCTITKDTQYSYSKVEAGAGD